MNATGHKFNRLMRLLGVCLTSFSMAAIVVNYNSPYQANYKNQIKSSIITSTPKPREAHHPPLEDSSLGAVIEEASSYGVDSGFSIVIPRIQAKSNIVANVDPFNREEYKAALKLGVAHAKTTALPGEGGTTYLFAHSTDTAVNVARYNAVFYELNKLEPNDEIIVFYNNQKFVYAVSTKHIIPADDSSWLNSNTSERLILQTCYPPGTALKRLLVIAEPGV
jgi:LPXTG-site transpeptidase (sortase) family protein